MKKPVKKATKKAVAKPPLIEGKYSHKFLTRLKPETGERLSEIMGDTANKTYNGAVVHIIDDYKRLVDELKEIKDRLNGVSQVYKVRSDQIAAFKEVFDKLFGDPSYIDLGISANHCKTCGQDLDEFGECLEGCDND